MKRADVSLTSAPTPVRGDSGSSKSVNQFFVMALNMSWQLAIVILVPVIAGVQLDKKLDTSYITFVGLAIGFIGSGVVMWRTMQVANSLPVPKLTDAERRAIKKQYEEDDKDA